MSQGVLFYTLIPAAAAAAGAGAGAAQPQPQQRLAVMLWRDRRTSEFESSTFWSHLICPRNAKLDASPLAAVCRVAAHKTHGWFAPVNELQRLRQQSAAAAKRKAAVATADAVDDPELQREELSAKHLRAKLSHPSGCTLLSFRSQHLIYLAPTRFIAASELNPRITDKGECAWVYADELLRFAMRSRRLASADSFDTSARDDQDDRFAFRTTSLLDLNTPASEPTTFPFLLSSLVILETVDSCSLLRDLLASFRALPDDLLDSSPPSSSVPSTSTSTTTAPSSSSPPADSTAASLRPTPSSSSSSSTSSHSFHCAKCRHRLFDASDLVFHELPNSHAPPRFAGKKPAASTTVRDGLCMSHFIQAGVPGMGDYSDNEGKLQCPKCSTRVGTFHWAGTQCSCGQWVTPAFQIPKSRVDEKRPLAAAATMAMPVIQPPIVRFAPKLSATNGSETGVAPSAGVSHPITAHGYDDDHDDGDDAEEEEEVDQATNESGETAATATVS